MRPYITAGVALVGASVIAVAPIAPHPDVHLPAVNLTAAIDNPIDVFAPVLNAAGSWFSSTIGSEIANPFPILHQIVTNQITTAGQLLQAINAGGAALGDLAAGLPATLQTALTKLASGDVNGAIDSVIASGLNPIISLITGVWTPLQDVLQRPFAVGQALVPALFNAGLSLVLAAVASTVGIGFDTGTAPLLQQIVTSTQSVLTAVTTLNPVNILNAIQHGFADVALNVLKQLDSLTTGTIPFIRDSIIAALQATPAAPFSAAVAAIPAAAAATVTLTASKSAAPSTVDEPEPQSTESVSAATSTETATTETPSTETASTEAPSTETASTETPDTESSTTPTKPTENEPTSLTRDSVKAEPGKVSSAPAGATTGTEKTPVGQTESPSTASGGEAAPGGSASGTGATSGSTDGAGQGD